MTTIKEWMDNIKRINEEEQKPYYIFKGTITEFIQKAVETSEAVERSKKCQS